MGHFQFHIEQRDLADVIAEAQAETHDNTPAMAEIIRRFEPLTKKLSREWTASYELQQDLANSARFALTRAVRRHNPAVPGFPAYAKRYMHGAVRRTSKQLRSLGTRDVEVNLVDFADAASETVFRPTWSTSDVGEWGGGEIEQALSSISADQLELLHDRYVEDADLQTIARRRATSVSAVSQRLTTVQRGLRQTLAV